MSFYDFLVYASLILWVLFGTGLVVSLILIVPKILSGFRTIDALTDAVVNRMLPVMERIDGAMQDVAQITDAVTDSVERIDDTIEHVTDSVERMLGIAEERVSEVNALVTVAVEEAEDTFLSAAGIVRALRSGRDRRQDRREDRRDRRSDRRKKRKKKRKKKDRWLRG